MKRCRSPPAAATPIRPLSSASRLQLVRRIPKQTLLRAGEEDPSMWGMSYNSARESLFLADWANKVVRSMRVRVNACDLRDVYRASHDTSPLMWSVCDTSDSNPLLVCSGENNAHWLVALSRNGREWREAHRVQTGRMGCICCALSGSQVLIGEYDSTYMELFRLESGPRIARVHRIHVPDKYNWFSATCSSDTLVAMSYPLLEKLVRVHRLRGDRLEELARIQLKNPFNLLLLAHRLLVADYDIEKH